jgi:ribosomal protein S18 acetylase RimI-like enzyme
MRVQPLAADDLAAALDLWARTEHLGPVPRAEVESLLGADPDLVLAAHHDGDLVGVVLGSYDGRRGWINRLAVDAGHRRHGVAAALLAELEERLRARGCLQVNLLVFSENRAGRAFWERHGYDSTEEVALYHRRLDGTSSSAGASSGPGC